MSGSAALSRSCKGAALSTLHSVRAAATEADQPTFDVSPPFEQYACRNAPYSDAALVPLQVTTFARTMNANMHARLCEVLTPL